MTVFTRPEPSIGRSIAAGNVNGTERIMAIVRKKPLQPVHVKGNMRGEETVLEKGREPGRGGPGHYRASRDSTSINPQAHSPIHPAMPSIPPA